MTHLLNRHASLGCALAAVAMTFVILLGSVSPAALA